MSFVTTQQGLRVARTLKEFIDFEALPGTGIESNAFWAGVASLLSTFAPRNAALLATRDSLQEQIDAWHRARGRGAAVDAAEYAAFLRTIGYLLPAPAKFEISTTGVDAEICSLAGCG